MLSSTSTILFFRQQCTVTAYSDASCLNKRQFWSQARYMYKIHPPVNVLTLPMLWTHTWVSKDGSLCAVSNLCVHLKPLNARYESIRISNTISAIVATIVSLYFIVLQRFCTSTCLTNVCLIQASLSKIATFRNVIIFPRIELLLNFDLSCKKDKVL